MNAKHEIDQLIQAFFALYTSKTGKVHRLDKIYEICLAEALIIKNAQGQTEIYDLPSFIAPREQWLSDGTLTDFIESEIHEKTDIFGHIAQRYSTYKKSGKHLGQAFEVYGMKSIQCILVNGAWKISAVAWDDESDTLKIPTT